MRFIRSRLVLCMVLGCLSLPLPVSAAQVVSVDDPAAQAFFSQSEAKAGFWKLMHYFESQVDQTYCGVASAAIVLNSLEVSAPSAPAIYPFRKFDQTNIFTDAVLAIKPPKLVHLGGLTLDELGKVIGTFGVKVTVYHADTPLDLDGFRKLASEALADPDARVIVNFQRKLLGQEGEGHHSPLGAYDATSDRFLLLDVARYKLPPVWASASDLWAAMATEDSDAHAKRGFLIIHRQ